MIINYNYSYRHFPQSTHFGSCHDFSRGKWCGSSENTCAPFFLLEPKSSQCSAPNFIFLSHDLWLFIRLSSLCSWDKRENFLAQMSSVHGRWAESTTHWMTMWQKHSKARGKAQGILFRMKVKTWVLRKWDRGCEVWKEHILLQSGLSLSLLYSVISLCICKTHVRHQWDDMSLVLWRSNRCHRVWELRARRWERVRGGIPLLKQEE